MPRFTMLKHRWVADVKYHLENDGTKTMPVSGELWAASFDDVEAIVLDDLDGPKGEVLRLTIVQVQSDGEWTREIDFENPGPKTTRPSQSLVEAWQSGKGKFNAPAVTSFGDRLASKQPPADKEVTITEPETPDFKAHKRPGKQNRKKKDPYPGKKDYWFGECDGVDMIHIDKHGTDEAEIKPFKVRVKLKA